MKITVEFDGLEEFQKHMTFGNEIKITSEGIVVRPKSPILSGQVLEEGTNVAMMPEKAEESAEKGEEEAHEAQDSVQENENA